MATLEIDGVNGLPRDKESSPEKLQQVICGIGGRSIGNCIKP